MTTVRRSRRPTCSAARAPCGNVRLHRDTPRRARRSRRSCRSDGARRRRVSHRIAGSPRRRTARSSRPSHSTRRRREMSGSGRDGASRGGGTMSCRMSSRVSHSRSVRRRSCIGRARHRIVVSGHGRRATSLICRGRLSPRRKDGRAHRHRPRGSATRRRGRRSVATRIGAASRTTRPARGPRRTDRSSMPNRNRRRRPASQPVPTSRRRRLQRRSGGDGNCDGGDRAMGRTARRSRRR